MDWSKLAAALHKRADYLRARAMNANEERRKDIVPEEEVDRWAVAFSTSYQTLRGLALVCEDMSQ